MKVIYPLNLAGYFSSSNVTEVHPTWSAGTAYDEDDIVVYNPTNRLYIRIFAGTTATAPNLDADNWLDYGPTNTWAMLDAENSTPTVMAGMIDVILLLAAGEVSVSLFGLVCTSVALNVATLGGTTTFSKTIAVTGTDVMPAQIFENNIVVPASSRLEIIIYGSTAKCGACVIGGLVYLGATQPGPKIQLLSFSKKETSPEGITTLVKGANSKRLSVQVETSNDDVQATLDTLTTLDGVPAAWQVTDIAKLAFLNGFGFSRDVSVDVTYEDTSLISLEVEYLT